MIILNINGLLPTLSNLGKFIFNLSHILLICKQFNFFSMVFLRIQLTGTHFPPTEDDVETDNDSSRGIEVFEVRNALFEQQKKKINQLHLISHKISLAININST